jgi:hypothetical protein
MILVLGRGGYCSKYRRQHEGLVRLHRELEVGYCRLVTITTGNITETNEFRTGNPSHQPHRGAGVLGEGNRSYRLTRGPRLLRWSTAV